MTQKELIQLLKQLSAKYPNAISKIDSRELLKNWEMAFGGEDAEAVYMAARLHMDLSPFFPTIADIKSNIRRGRLVYGQPPEAPQLKIVGEVGEEAPCRLERCILYHDLCNGLDENGECPFEGL